MSALAADAMVGVVGAGVMGAGIAQVAAAAGHPVQLYDVAPGAAGAAIGRIDAALAARVEKGRISAADKDRLIRSIQPVARSAELAPCALVVEAAVEDLAVKRDLFAELEAVVGADAILASNTSSLSITAIGRDLERPGRLVGMHFFNPPPLMALVEVVSGLATEPAVAGRVFATAERWGKHPVHAASTPGFIVNRVARPFYAEALRVLAEGGADIATLDAVMREAGGFRMGPFELMDLIGHDVNFAVTNSVYRAMYQDPRYRPSLRQQELVDSGRLGRKSGRGFYDYTAGVERPAPRSAAPATPPREVILHGDLGPLEPLTLLIERAGIRLQRTAGAGPGWLELDGSAALALTDGRSATERMATAATAPLVLLDLALDYPAASRVALAGADQAGPRALALATGLMQALGKAVSVLDDVPGLAVMRTVCMLANEAADAVHQGVCDAGAVDTAMCKGVNYPLGPLAWSVQIGLGTVVAVLDNLQRGYGDDHYRVAPLLRRKFHTGGDWT